VFIVVVVVVVAAAAVVDDFVIDSVRKLGYTLVSCH
jgi:hypothetical protein